MARLLAYFTRDIDQKTHVLVATSGDTGSAVANGFLDVEKIDVHILYPSGLVSYLQEKQFTTLGRNITALEVKGNFDDCQRLVKEAFLDREVNSRIRLTSANSINIARLLPQSFYYFNAYRQVPDPGKPIVIAVPSGNFGNLTAGLIAGRMGLPVKHFIAATNINDVVPEYLETGAFLPRPSLPTIANAMDVGNPSNFSRILDLYEHSHQRITQQLSGFAYTDQQIRDAIRQVHSQTGYILDPHGATAYMALIEYMKTDPSITGIFPETAHPAKFEDIVEDSIGKAIDIPERLSKFSKAEKKSILISRDYPGFKDYLMNLGRS
jgi:threonine synthase